MPPKKFYAVWAGHKPGIYTTWAEAEKQVKSYPKAGFKSFPTLALAKEAFAKGTAVPKESIQQHESLASSNSTNETAAREVAGKTGYGPLVAH